MNTTCTGNKPGNYRVSPARGVGIGRTRLPSRWWLAPQSCRQGQRRTPARKPGLAVLLASLAALNGIDAKEPDPLAVDLDSVAIDHDARPVIVTSSRALEADTSERTTARTVGASRIGATNQRRYGDDVATACPGSDARPSSRAALWLTRRRALSPAQPESWLPDSSCRQPGCA